MGDRDRENRDKGIGVAPGCLCNWCTNVFNAIWLCDQNSYQIRSLADGEIQPITKYAPGVKRIRYAPYEAGCLAGVSLVTIDEYMKMGLTSPIGAGRGNVAKPVLHAGVSAVSLATGHNCNVCNQRNDYASSNQKDGSYVCYNCR